jgi:hypothetical protein
MPPSDQLISYSTFQTPTFSVSPLAGVHETRPFGASTMTHGPPPGRPLAWLRVLNVTLVAVWRLIAEVIDVVCPVVGSVSVMVW